MSRGMRARRSSWRARGGCRCSRPTRAKSDVPGEGHQPPLAYALIAPLAAWSPREERQFDMPGNPRFTGPAPSARGRRPS